MINGEFIKEEIEYQVEIDWEGEVYESAATVTGEEMGPCILDKDPKTGEWVDKEEGTRYRDLAEAAAKIGHFNRCDYCPYYSEYGCAQQCEE